MREKLKNLRKACGYTQYTIAAALDIARTTYSQIELGTKQPSYKVVLRIKRLLRYDGDDLFDNADIKPHRGRPFAKRPG